MSDVQILHGDCLELLQDIPSQSIDMILCDLPYGVTSCKWDSVIPLELLWAHYERVTKPGGAIVLTAQQPFTSTLVMSRPKLFKYAWVWDKKIPGGMAYARYQPMRRTEDVLVFSKGKARYFPIMELRDKPIRGKVYTKTTTTTLAKYIDDNEPARTYTHKNPVNLLQFQKIRAGALHPTQKPVELFEYLIRTYTLPGETVLDNCAGSGTTGVAALNTGRKAILIEKDDHYVEVCRQRAECALAARESGS